MYNEGTEYYPNILKDVEYNNNKNERTEEFRRNSQYTV
jgi:hypothetical protein